MHRTVKGVVQDANEEMSRGAPPSRTWRPTIRVAREHPAPGQPSEELMLAHIGDWFLGVPWPNHRIEAAGEWHDEGNGRGYLEVESYTDTDATATFAKRPGRAEEIPPITGDISKWRELTISEDNVAFAFTLQVNSDQARTVAFRGRAKNGVRGLGDGARVEVHGRQDTGLVIYPQRIVFPNDPSMPDWKGKNANPWACATITAFIFLVLAVVPWLMAGVFGPQDLDRGIRIAFAVWSGFCGLPVAIIISMAIARAIRRDSGI